MRKFIAYFILLLSFLIIYGSAAFALIVEEEYVVTPSLLLSSLVINIFIMVFPAMVFAYLLYGRVWEELYFRREGLGKSILYGAALSITFMILSSLALIAIGYNEENPLAEEIGKNINIPLLILIPLISSFTEEIYFRGLIQMQIEKKNVIAGIVISSILFSLAHLEYGVAIQVIMPFIFGLFLGILMHHCRNIAAPITAHFIYNFVSLAILLYH